MSSWADRRAIEALYAEAARSGLEVDHIIPLQGKEVCGLHVEGNLRLMKKLENQRKGNRFQPQAEINLNNRYQDDPPFTNLL